MKITNVDVIKFKTTEYAVMPPHRWSFGSCYLPGFHGDPKAAVPKYKVEDYLFGPGVKVENTK